MQLIIREATVNDIPAIQQIATTTWAATYTFLSPEQMEYMLDWMYSSESLLKQMQDNHRFYMAVLNNEAMGFASVLHEEENIFKLNKLYVLPTTQKTGAGKALLKVVIDYAKQNGGKQIQLQVNRHNNAKDFYLKHGFTILYEADFEIGNGFFMNDYVMGKNL